MKNIFIILSVILTLTLVMCSCGKSESNDNSTVIAEETSEEIMTESTMDTTKKESEDISETEPTEVSDIEETTAPTEIPDALIAFNNAVSISSCSASYSVSGSKASFDPDFLNSFFTDEDIAKQNVKNQKITDSKITEINSSDIESADIKESGNEFVTTIKLKDVSVPASSKTTQKGYIWFMDTAAVTEKIHIVNPELDLKSQGTIALKNGIITAAVSKETGKFTSLKITLDESVNDQVRMESLQSKIESLPKIVRDKLPSEIYGTFDYSISVTYKF